MSNITKSFGKGAVKNVVLNDVSINITPHIVTTILGASGAGKTLFGRVIAGFEKIDSGALIIDGIKLTQQTEAELRRKVGFVFQSFNLFNNMNVFENLVYAPINVDCRDKSEVYIQAEQMMKKFKISHCKDLYPFALSGGQKQRVAIARSFMMNPEIVIMDEPTSALDPHLVSDVIDLIKELSDLKVTIIIITHDMRVAKLASDRVVFLSNGRILDDRPTAECFVENKCSAELAHFIARACF